MDTYRIYILQANQEYLYSNKIWRLFSVIFLKIQLMQLNIGKHLLNILLIVI